MFEGVTNNASSAISGAIGNITSQAKNGVGAAQSALGTAKNTVNDVANQATSVVNNVASTASTTVKAATEQANMAINMANNIAGGLTDKIPNIDTSAISGAIDGIAGEITGAISSFSSQVDGLISKGEAMLSGVMSAIDAAATFPDAISNLFQNININTKALTDIAQDITKGLKEPQTLIESLSSSDSKAKSNPVSFVTKPIMDAIKGAETQAKGQQPDVLDLPQDLVDKIEKATGSSISSKSDLNKVIKNVTNNLAKEIKNNRLTAKGLAYSNSSSSSTFFSKSTVNNYRSSLTSSLEYTYKVHKDFGQGNTTNTTVKTTITVDKNTNKQAVNSIPNKIQNWIASKDPNYILEQAKTLIKDTNQTFKNSLSSLTGISNINDVQNIVLKLGSDSKYSSMVNEAGEDLSDKYGSNSDRDLTVLYNAAKKICPYISKEQVIKFKENKNQYDVLIQLAAQRGAMDLLEQLAECPGAAYYFDQRTIELLKMTTAGCAAKGDAIGYRTLQKIIGSENLTSARIEVVVLNANMRKTDINIKTYKEIIDDLKLTVKNLITPDGKPSVVMDVFDGIVATLMSATNTTIVDEAIGINERKLVEALITNY